MSEQISIVRPLQPDKDEFFEAVERVMASNWLTNMGGEHDSLEKELAEFLEVDNIAVFNNGTSALLAALLALDLPKGAQIITTPFTFIATVHAIVLAGFEPVFVDIEPDTFTLAPEKVEQAVNEKTAAILPVHVYGFPCRHELIEEIAKKHNLKLVYDAAHAFGTKVNNKSIGLWGDVTMLSFHATKLFNTIEGGALVSNDSTMIEACKRLRNFGIRPPMDRSGKMVGIKDSSYISEIGLNGKLNELQAAWGRLVLKRVSQEQRQRKKIFEYYTKSFQSLDEISVPGWLENVTKSYQYFPVLIDNARNRDGLFEHLKANSIMPRKYFYPLCSDFSCYQHLDSSNPDELPISRSVAERVLCLPISGDLLENGGLEMTARLTKEFFVGRT